MGGGTIFGFYGGNTAVMKGDIELMGWSPSPSPTRENPGSVSTKLEPAHSKSNEIALINVLQNLAPMLFNRIILRIL